MSLTKRIKSAAAALLGATFLWTAPALATGTTPLALAVQADSAGNPVPGCLLYFFVAGTVASPQTAYADFGLTSPLPNPLQCDQSGRVPMHWLADGLIHIRLTDSLGGQIIDTTMQVLGPSSGGGGGGGTVDPTTLIQTGNVISRYGTGPISGYVRMNGLSIGNATSGASERANADTQALYVYLYNADPNLGVSGGRTGNALNDFNASKQLSLPDQRGRSLVALADMGNTPTAVLTASFYATSVTTLGANGGFQSQALSTPNLPPYTPSGSVGVSVSGTAPVQGSYPGTTIGGAAAEGTNTSGLLSIPLTLSSSGSFAGSPQGGTSSPFSTIQPSMLVTFYIKL